MQYMKFDGALSWLSCNQTWQLLCEPFTRDKDLKRAALCLGSIHLSSSFTIFLYIFDICVRNCFNSQVKSVHEALNVEAC